MTSPYLHYGDLPGRGLEGCFHHLKALLPEFERRTGIKVPFEVVQSIISYYIYQTTFMGLGLAQASAVSYLLLVVVLGLTAALFSALLKQEAV